MVNINPKLGFANRFRGLAQSVLGRSIERDRDIKLLRCVWRKRQ